LWKLDTLNGMNELRVGLIGGTGLADALNAEGGIRHDVDTPFGKPSDAIIETRWTGVTTLILSRHGQGHLINPGELPSRANIFALKKLGCTHILASGAVGSLREEFKPRDLVIPEQVIDRTNGRPRTFFEKAAVHVEFAEPFCPVLRRILLDAGAGLSTSDGGAVADPAKIGIHDRGCYVCMEGPTFSSRAESLMHRLWGGDLIGMTALPEAKLAREAEIPYALVALVTDYDCWKAHGPESAPGAEPAKRDPFALLNEILGNLKIATANAVQLMRRAVELMGTRTAELADCPAKDALKLAIWSDKSKIPQNYRELLAPLWMKYFEPSRQQS
jgi:5'-methylthioadenosine phosphorylase